MVKRFANGYNVAGTKAVAPRINVVERSTSVA
jgi:hypothetical protein